MDKGVKAAVNDLSGNFSFGVVVAQIEKLAPLVPDYKPDENNVEEMKFRSAQKQLHDLVMAILKPKEQ